MYLALAYPQTRLGAYYSQHKKLKKIVKSLKETIDQIENYIEDRTGVEFGKNLLDSDSDSDSDLPFCDLQLRAEKKVIKEQA